jgi:hypothetical protein
MLGAPALSSTVRLKLLLATLGLLLAWALIEAGPSRDALSTPTGGSAFSTLGSIGVPDELFVEQEINAGLISALGQSVGADGIAGVGSSVLGSPVPQPAGVPLSGLTGAVLVAPSSSDGGGAQGQSVSFPSDSGPSTLDEVSAESDAGAPGDEDEGDDGDNAAAPPAAGGAQATGSSGDDGGEGEASEDGDDEDEDGDEDEDEDEDDEDDDD